MTDHYIKYIYPLKCRGQNILIYMYVGSVFGHAHTCHSKCMGNVSGKSYIKIKDSTLIHVLMHVVLFFFFLRNSEKMYHYSLYSNPYTLSVKKKTCLHEGDNFKNII